MARGSRIHQEIENYLEGVIERLSHELEFYHGFFATLKEQPAIKPEHKWAFDEKWEECGFTDPQASIRGVVDATLLDGKTAHVYEYKTGKRYPDHEQQRALYGLAALLLYPMAEEAIVTTIYLDQQVNESTSYAKDMLASYKWLWDRRIAKVQPPQDYPLRPNWKCRFCAYSKGNGGTCLN